MPRVKERRYDIHIHTNCSDGVCTPADVIRHAKELGLAGVAITDHDTVEGIPRAMKMARQLDIEFIPGVEITTPFGDILALGIEEVISGRAKGPADIISIVDKIHDRGGVAIIAHPFAGFWNMSFPEIIDDIKKCIDAIEVFNSLTNVNFGLEANIEAMRLSKKIGLPGTGGSDAHTLDLVGTAFTIPEQGDLITAIKKGKIKVGWL